MLLSHTVNSRVVMDHDFSDQDWFAESDEAVNNKHSTDPTSPLQAPTDVLQFHGEFLELNVPVDENIYYVEQQPQNRGPYLEAPTPSTSNRFEAQNGDSDDILPAVVLTGREARYLQTLPKQHEQQRKSTISENEEGFNERRSLYMDCPPTTSLAVLKPFHSVPQQNENHQQQHGYTVEQQSCQVVGPSMPVNRFLQSTDLALRPMNSDHFQTLVSDCTLGNHLQPTYTDLSSTNYTNSVLPEQQYYPAGHQSIGLKSTQFSSQSSAELAIPANFLRVKDQSAQKEQFGGNAKTVARKTSRPKKKAATPVAPTLTNQNTTQAQQRENEATESSGLDQIAKQLFSNQQTATLEINDPLSAMEFATLMGRCQQLNEQKAAGMDVGEELKAAEASIANFIMKSMSTTKNDATPTTSESAPIQLQSFPNAQKTAPSAPKKRNRSKKKPTPSTLATPTISANFAGQLNHFQEEPIIEPVTRILQPNGTTIFCGNGLQQPSGMTEQQFLPALPISQRPTTGIPFPKEKLASTSLPVPNPPNSTEPGHSTKNTHQTRHFVVHQLSKNNDHRTEMLLPILVPETLNHGPQNRKASTSKQHVVYARRNIRVIKQESVEEIAAKKAQQTAKHKKRLEDQFCKMREQIQIQDYKRPFKNKMDGIQRLLPFSLLSEVDLSRDFLNKFDTELQSHSNLMDERRKFVERRFQSALFREALGEMDEDKNLLLFLDSEFERDQLTREIRAKDSSFDTSFLAPKQSNNLNWEYNNDWNPEQYLNIEPFTPELVYSDAEKYEDEEFFAESDSDVEEKEGDVILFKEEERKQIESEFAAVKVNLEVYHTENTIQTESFDFAAAYPNSEEFVTSLDTELSEEIKDVYTEADKVWAKEVVEHRDKNSQSLNEVGASFDTNVHDSEEKLTSAGRKLDNILTAINEGSPLIEPIALDYIVIRPCVNMLQREEEVELQKPMKLKIKLTNPSALNQAETEKKIRKEIKRQKKEEKRAKKRMKKENEKQQKFKTTFNDFGQTAASPSDNLMKNNNDSEGQAKSPLKISLRRVPCRNNEDEKQESLGKTSATTVNDEPGFLKLRIPKQILGKNVGQHHQINGTNEAENGEIIGKERKSRKRKQTPTIPNDDQTEEKKVPRIKIRFGTAANPTEEQPGKPRRSHKNCLLNQEDASPQKILDCSPTNSSLQQNIPIVGPNNVATTTSNCAVNPSLCNFSSSDAPKTETAKQQKELATTARIGMPETKQILQFSPCSSDDDSDNDELRQRTNQLLSKIGRL